jgi:hypothetical protein
VKSGRLEYGSDWANQPFFAYSGMLGSNKSQNTRMLDVVAYLQAQVLARAD